MYSIIDIIDNLNDSYLDILNRYNKIKSTINKAEGLSDDAKKYLISTITNMQSDLSYDIGIIHDIRSYIKIEDSIQTLKNK